MVEPSIWTKMLVNLDYHGRDPGEHKRIIASYFLSWVFRPLLFVCLEPLHGINRWGITGFFHPKVITPSNLGFYSQWPPVTQFSGGHDWDELNRRERPEAKNFLNITLVQPPKKRFLLWRGGILLTSKVTKKIISEIEKSQQTQVDRWLCRNCSSNWSFPH